MKDDSSVVQCDKRFLVDCESDLKGLQESLAKIPHPRVASTELIEQSEPTYRSRLSKAMKPICEPHVNVECC